MKRIAIISIGLLLIASPLFAAAITDATQPLGHMKASVAAEDNYVFHKKIKAGDNRSSFKIEKLNQIYAKASLGLTPYFNLYGKIGAGDGGEIKTQNRDNQIDIKVDTDYGFL
jgi:hypothetical protein